MKVTKKLKAQFKIITTLCITLFGGITIWSCSQDELDENGQPVYRYTAEEIATLKTLAEEYEFPTKDLVFKSDTELPTIKEWEEFFQISCAIRQAFSNPIAISATDNNRIIYRTQPPATKKRRITATEGYSGTHSESIIDHIYHGDCFLIFDVHWSYIPPTSNDPRARMEVQIYPSCELSTWLIDKGYYLNELQTEWHIAGLSTIVVEYSYTLKRKGFQYQTFQYTEESSFDVNTGIKYW